MSYEERLLALFIFMAAMLILDLKNPPLERSRFKAYSFILSVGMLGAIFGMGVDAITSRISEDYFVYGKGLRLSNPQQFMRDALTLGAKAGFSGALFVGCIFCFCNPLKTSVRHLYHYLTVPFLMSLFFGIFFGVIQYVTNSIVLNQILFLGEERSRLYATVWMSHLGLYCGGFISLPVICRKMRKGIKLTRG